MDDKDHKIIEFLKINSRASTREIAKRVKIPITTVHSRIKRLEAEEVINQYTVKLDKKKIGKNISSFILITVDYKFLKQNNMSQHDLARKLKQKKEVEEVSIVTGGTDIIIKVALNDIDDLDNFITKILRNIEGIEKTQTMVILKEI